MTKRQAEKLAELSGQLGLAALIGAVGDIVITGTRIFVDSFGMAVGVILLVTSVYLTGLLGGDRV